MMLSRWEPFKLMSSLSRNGDIGLYKEPLLLPYEVSSIYLTPELDAF